jgi:hypothetical protein
MTCLKIFQYAGAFAENKDVACKLRVEVIEPALEKGDVVALDFAEVSGATQSFIHALISELFRKHGGEVLDRIDFKNCNNTIQKVITIVSDYMQEAEGI